MRKDFFSLRFTAWRAFHALVWLAACAAILLGTSQVHGQILKPKAKAFGLVPASTTSAENLGTANTAAETSLPPAAARDAEQGPAGASIRAQGVYTPITAAGRLKWFAWTTAGPESLAAGLFAPAIGTAENSPKEYGPHWDGFGKRYGIRMSGVAASNAMEAGLGALWGEDPRYARAAGKSFGGRVKNIIVMTFETRRRDGRVAPAYARYMAYAGSNFLSNTWRADSEATSKDAGQRIGYAFLATVGGNAFAEFWPDVKKFVFHHGH